MTQLEEVAVRLGISPLALVGAAPLPESAGVGLGDKPFYRKNYPRTKKIGVGKGSPKGEMGAAA